MSASTDTPSRKPVVIRFPEPMCNAIKAHQALMAKSMGGASVPFTQAVLHLIQSSLDATSATPESI
jgi:hypothetical protein